MSLKKGKIEHRKHRDIVLESLIRGKQPVVHSTFRLSQEAHNAIKELGDVLDIKNAELFEELFDRLLIFFEASQTSKIPIILDGPRNNATIRKTYVVKKVTLTKLSKLAKDKKKTRDLLIERTAIAFKKILEGVLSDKKERYSNVLEKTINPFWQEAEDIEGRLSKELGSDDPIVSRFSYVRTVLMTLSMAIESYLGKGTPIDPDDFSQQS